MKKVYLSLLSLLTVSAFADPVVSNIRASQRENTKMVDILYDVSYSGGSNVSVTCEVSTNSGATYTVPAKSFSGTGYGAIVTTGTDRLITWDAGVDWNEKYSEQMKVRLTAKAPRFTVNQNSYYDDNSILVYSAGDTVTDNQTGLIWATRPISYATNWHGAANACSSMGDGWRLPTFTEFRSLLDANRTPALPAGHPFKNIRSDFYWCSSPTSGGNPPHLNCFSMITGLETYLFDNSSAVAWPVRSIY